VQDCIAKWFGQWRNFSGQPDVSSMYAFEPADETKNS